jgi:hypothetical protein
MSFQWSPSRHVASPSPLCSWSQPEKAAATNSRNDDLGYICVASLPAGRCGWPWVAFLERVSTRSGTCLVSGVLEAG